MSKEVISLQVRNMPMVIIGRMFEHIACKNRPETGRGVIPMIFKNADR